MSALLNPVPPAPTPQAQPSAPVPEKKSARPAWWWALGLIMVAAVVAVLWNRSTEETVARQAVVLTKTAKVVAGPLEQSVRVSGQTSARDFVNVTAPRLAGPEANRPLIIQTLVKSGVFVKKGDLLVEIDGQSLADHIDDVQSTVLQAEADVRKRKAEQEVEWENLQQNVRLAKAELDKLRADARAAEVRTVIDQELIKLAVEESEAKYRQLLEETKLKQVSQGSETRILGFTQERHTRHRDRHKRDITRFTIRSPIDGLAVVQTVWRGGEFVAIGEGDQVSPGQLIVKVVNPKSMQVEATINQAESGRFRLGQEAKVTLDAYPGLQLRGRVDSIGAIAVSGFRQQAYIRNIPVRIQVLDQHDKLIPDLSAAAQVIIGRQDSANLVPLAAVRTNGQESVVYVRQGEQFVPRKVLLGQRNEIQAAVTAGLSAGDEVALNYEVASAAK